MMRKRDMYVQQYKAALDQLDILKKIDPEKLLTKVEFGAIVITDKQKLFIACGLGKVKAGKNSYYAISPMVPFYASIEGLSEGDIYTFRDTSGKILEVM
jgi:hypothetical protein